MKQRRKICIVTGSRADYGHYFWLLKEIKADKNLQLQMAVTAAHLSKDHGLTYRLIEKDGFSITAKIPILTKGESEVDVVQSIGTACGGFAKAFAKIKPDIIVVLGDRYEMLAASIAAHVLKIPLAHIHGGEATEGAIDESFRHSITKFSDLHFTTTEDYRRRVIQLGEQPGRVFNFGAPGLDAISKLKFLTKRELQEKISFDLTHPAALVTYHPVTLENENPIPQIKTILQAIEKSSIYALFTQSNADPHGQKIFNMIKAFCRKNPAKYKVVSTLGHELYYNCLKHFDIVLGNSSSGIIEAPSFGIPVINIGDRQKGRIKGRNVLDVSVKERDILDAIKVTVDKEFRSQINPVSNPYVKRNKWKASFKIKEKLKRLRIVFGFKKKKFYDIELNMRF